MKKKNSSKATSSKATAAMLAAGVVATGAAGVYASGTLAYLTDQSDVSENHFVMGDVKIETIDTYTQPINEVVPNQQIPKVVSVNNVGKNDAIVFIELDVPQEDVTTISDDGTTKTAKTRQDLVYFEQSSDAITTEKNNFSSAWTLLDDKSNAATKKHTYIFGLNTRLAESTQATPLFEQIQVRNIVENEVLGGTDLQVDVKTYAIQADNIVGSTGAVDTGATMSKDTLTDIYNRLVKQSGATSIPINK